MRHFLFKFSILFLLPFTGYGQTANISGVINTYVKVNQLGSGACIDSIYVTSAAGFSVNDTVLLIQMKGADIDTTNTAAFGTILNYNNVGNYEFGYIKTIIGNTIVLTGNLQRTYSVTGSLQLVRVPNYVNANVNGILTADPWNGQTGGVLVFTATGAITLSANMEVSGKGFRNGDGSLNYYSTWYTGYFCTHASGRGGDKGEGISTVSTQQQSGRGANSSGGGGGNDINTGAGGGGNGGAGGHGGNNFFSPSLLWGDGGKSLDHTASSNRLYLGGGGGGGHQNNNEGSNGEDGGGIILIRATSLTGNGFVIKANGKDVLPTSVIDGAGGGGAGGSILVDIQNYTGNVTIEAKGGNGGNQIYIPQCHGNGGGGGGGAIKKSGSTAFPVNVTTSIAGGNKGIGQCNNTPNDAANGGVGTIVSNILIPVENIITADAGPDAMICNGASIQLGALPQPGLTYSWNNGVGSTANPTVAPVVTTTYILTVSTTGLCPITDADTVTVIVMPQPQAAFTYSADCSGLLVSFTNTSTGNATSIWNFGDGTNSVLSAPTHLFGDTGYYNIQLIVSTAAGCSDTLTQTIYLDLPLYPTASFTSDTTACSLNVVFNNTSNFASGTLWNFGDGNSSTQNNPVHNYALSGTYQVTLIVSNLCGSDTASISLTIDPVIMPVAAFTVDSAFCSATVDFINNSTAAVSWAWDFGDGGTSTLANPAHSYMIPGNYTVNLVAVNGCGTDTLSQQFTLENFNPPVAAFTPDVTPCDSAVSFINNSLNSLSAFWSFGDGDTITLENPIHNYAGPGTYNVMLITTNACGSDTVIVPTDLSILSPPVATFTHEISPCSAEVKFENASTNDFEWLWSFGDSNFSIEENPFHEYENPGVYEVLLIVNPGSGCQDSASAIIYVDDTGISGLFVPNVFTPNNDGKNDKFYIFSATQCEFFNLTIFNRWGQEIFATGNIAESWDGNYNGTKAPDGVYFYILKGKKKSRHGTVSLLR